MIRDDGLVGIVPARSRISDVDDSVGLTGYVLALCGSSPTVITSFAAAEEPGFDVAGVTCALNTAGFLGTGGGRGFRGTAADDWWEDVVDATEVMDGVRITDPGGRLGSDGA